MCTSRVKAATQDIMQACQHCDIVPVFLATYARAHAIDEPLVTVCTSHVKEVTFTSLPTATFGQARIVLHCLAT